MLIIYVYVYVHTVRVCVCVCVLVSLAHFLNIILLQIANEVLFCVIMAYGILVFFECNHDFCSICKVIFA